MTDPQLAHRRAFAEINDAGGRFRALNPPFPCPTHRPQPRLMWELLTEIGYTPSRITALLNPERPSP